MMIYCFFFSFFSAFPRILTIFVDFCINIVFVVSEYYRQVSSEAKFLLDLQNYFCINIVFVVSEYYRQVSSEAKFLLDLQNY